MKISDQVKIDCFYRAITYHDEHYLGTFFFGVKTTGIFCIPTCKARTPKKENVEFYTDINDLLQNGYRPCKKCKPTENAYEMPKEIHLALKLVGSNLPHKISDQKLREKNIHPEKVRRWFKKHYGITFHTYQRMLRINAAFDHLKRNKTDVINTAYGSGYESLSGFGYTFKKITGFSPNQSSNRSIILIERITTPLGPMFIGAAENGICLLEFSDRKMLETEFKDLEKRLNAQIILGENRSIKKLKKQLKEYFQGKRKEFDIQIVTPGTDFQQKAWDTLRTIPYGKTRSYEQQAEKLGDPKLVGAVIKANGMNRIAILIPCHRLVDENSNLRGYSGGLERKKWLLEHEKKYSN